LTSACSSVEMRASRLREHLAEATAQEGMRTRPTRMLISADTPQRADADRKNGARRHR
jgi:hypothetical protein